MCLQLNNGLCARAKLLRSASELPTALVVAWVVPSRAPPRAARARKCPNPLPSQRERLHAARAGAAPAAPAPRASTPSRSSRRVLPRLVPFLSPRVSRPSPRLRAPSPRSASARRSPSSRRALRLGLAVKTAKLRGARRAYRGLLRVISHARSPPRPRRGRVRRRAPRRRPRHHHRRGFLPPRRHRPSHWSPSTHALLARRRGGHRRARISPTRSKHWTAPSPHPTIPEPDASPPSRGPSSPPRTRPRPEHRRDETVAAGSETAHDASAGSTASAAASHPMLCEWFSMDGCTCCWTPTPTRLVPPARTCSSTPVSSTSSATTTTRSRSS